MVIGYIGYKQIIIGFLIYGIPCCYMIFPIFYVILLVTVLVIMRRGFSVGKYTYVFFKIPDNISNIFQ